MTYDEVKGCSVVAMLMMMVMMMTTVVLGVVVRWRSCFVLRFLT